MTALTAPHLGGVTVGGVYHGEVREEGAQVGDHALDRAPAGLGDKHDITYSEHILLSGTDSFTTCASLQHMLLLYYF